MAWNVRRRQRKHETRGSAPPAAVPQLRRRSPLAGAGGTDRGAVGPDLGAAPGAAGRHRRVRRAESWRGDGAVSMIAWVIAQCGVSTSTARQWVRAAVNLKSLPCLAEGLASGELSLDLVEPLAEVASPSSDAALREASAHWSVRQARELAAWHRARKEAEAEARAAAAGCSAAAAAMTGLGMTKQRLSWPRTRGPGVRAPDAAVQRLAAVGMGCVHQGRLRGGQVAVWSGRVAAEKRTAGVGSARVRALRQAPLRRLMHLFRCGTVRRG